MQEIAPIDRLSLPADIRKASVEQQQQYASAQQFEQMLVQKMMAQMTTSPLGEDSDDGESGEDGSGSSDAVSAHYKDLLPELMAKTVTSGDGLGIARDLYDAMQKKP